MRPPNSQSGASRPTSHTIEVGQGGARRGIACLRQEGAGPELFWLQGFKSDMVSTKAAALADWAGGRGVALTRFDYSGHGQSIGPGSRFEDGTIGRWAAEAQAVFEGLTRGPQIVIGSSMGGYIALLLLRRLLAEAPAQAARIKALLLIAPAWDMTEELMWKAFPDEVRAAVMRDGVWSRPSLYGEPYPITRALIEDGRRHLIGRERWAPGRPVVILHGRLDPDVPFGHSQALAATLEGGVARIVEVPDGEHRLSRPQDLAVMLRLVEELRG